jgi:hypothetical protein
MDPVIVEFLGGLLVGAIAGLTIVFRARHPSPKTMPMLAVRKTRSASSVRHRRSSLPKERTRSTVTVPRTRKNAKTKTLEPTVESSQTPHIAASTMAAFDTCPSCGLQAPGSLLAEHFLGSPSHKNGPPEIVKVEPAEIKAAEEAEKEDSKQSMRDLLQMLVPPRAFGRRHAHRSMGPISSIVKDLGPPNRRLS